LNESIALVKGAGIVILGMYGHCTDTRNVSCLQASQDGIAKHSAANAFALPTQADCETRQQHYRNRMACKPLRQSLWCAIVKDFSNDQRIKADYVFAGETNIGLRGICLLILKCVAGEKSIERFLSTVEHIDKMRASQFLDTKLAHAGS